MAVDATRQRGPVRISVRRDAWDEQRMELDALRHAAIEHCDFAEPRLDFLHPIAIELGPVPEQLIAGILYSLARLRRRAKAASA